MCVCVGVRLGFFFFLEVGEKFGMIKGNKCSWLFSVFYCLLTVLLWKLFIQHFNPLEEHLETIEAEFLNVQN